MFKPILDTVGQEYDTQIRVELACILSILLKDETTPLQDINAAIDEWLSSVPLVDRKRLLDVVSNPKKENDKLIVELAIFDGPGKGKRFRVTSACENIFDIQNDETKIKIEEISAAAVKSDKTVAIVVTIDGLSGVGKSSTARRIAEKLNAVYFPYSITYRLVTVLALNEGISLSENMSEEGLGRLINVANTMDLSLFRFERQPDGQLLYFYSDRCINKVIYTDEVNHNVPFVSKVPEVREGAKRQVKEAMNRSVEAGKSWVIEGRVTGTEIAPDADVKIYLSSEARVRAERRAEQKIKKEGRQLSHAEKMEIIDEVYRDILERDRLDSGREHMPAEKPEGAVEIDTTYRSLDESVSEILEIINGLEDVVHELEQDMVLDDKTRGRLRDFYRKYTVLRERFTDKRYSRDDKYLKECFSARRIADLFYLSEGYGFNIFDLLGEKAGTEWVKKFGEKNVRYRFRVTEDNSITMDDVSDGVPEKGEIAKATRSKYGVKDRQTYSGLNIGNFVIKLQHLVMWAKEGKRDVDLLIAVDSGINDLIRYYQTIGAKTYMDFDRDERMSMDLFGGLDAALLTAGQATRLRDRDPKTWRVWSQRSLDRYFRSIGYSDVPVKPAAKEVPSAAALDSENTPAVSRSYLRHVVKGGLITFSSAAFWLLGSWVSHIMSDFLKIVFYPVRDRFYKFKGYPEGGLEEVYERSSYRMLSSYGWWLFKHYNWIFKNSEIFKMPIEKNEIRIEDDDRFFEEMPLRKGNTRSDENVVLKLDYDRIRRALLEAGEKEAADLVANGVIIETVFFEDDPECPFVFVEADTTSLKYSFSSGHIKETGGKKQPVIYLNRKLVVDWMENMGDFRASSAMEALIAETIIHLVHGRSTGSANVLLSGKANLGINKENLSGLDDLKRWEAYKYWHRISGTFMALSPAEPRGLLGEMARRSKANFHKLFYQHPNMFYFLDSLSMSYFIMRPWKVSFPIKFVERFVNRIVSYASIPREYFFNYINRIVHSGFFNSFNSYKKYNYYWLLEAGFSGRTAGWVTSFANRRTDDLEKGFIPVIGDQSRHYNMYIHDGRPLEEQNITNYAGKAKTKGFNKHYRDTLPESPLKRDTRKDWARQEFLNAAGYYAANDTFEALKAIGRGAHSLQDMPAHLGFDTGRWMTRIHHPDFDNPKKDFIGFDEKSQPVFVDGTNRVELTGEISVLYYKAFRNVIDFIDREGIKDSQDARLSGKINEELKKVWALVDPTIVAVQILSQMRANNAEEFETLFRKISPEERSILEKLLGLNNSSAPRMSRRVWVPEKALRFTSDDKSTAEINVFKTGTKDKVGILKLEKNELDPVEIVKVKIKDMGLRDEKHKDFLLSILKRLEKSPPLLYEFETLIEDLFGFVMPAKGLIAVHKEFIDKPIALLHELMEYMIKSGKMSLVIKKSVVTDGGREKLLLVVRLKGEGEDKDEVMEIEISEEVLESLSHGEEWWHKGIAWLNESGNEHYLLRVFQRTVLWNSSGESLDRRFTHIIWEEQIPVLAKECKVPVTALSAVTRFDVVREHLVDIAEEGKGILSLRPMLGEVSDCFFDWSGTLGVLERDRAGMHNLFQVLRTRGIRIHIITDGSNESISTLLGKNLEFVNSVIQIADGLGSNKGMVMEPTFKGGAELRLYHGSKQQYINDYMKIRHRDNAHKVLIVEDSAQNLRKIGDTISLSRVICVGVVPDNKKPSEIDMDSLMLNNYGSWTPANYYTASLSNWENFVALVDLIERNGKNGDILVKQPAQMGKEAVFTGVVRTDQGSYKAEVRDSNSRIQTLDLSLRGEIGFDQVRGIFSGMTDIEASHSDLLLGIVGLLENSPPRFYSYTDLIDDLFGFISQKYQFIALYNNFINNPVALFHEISEYLIRYKMLDLRLDDNTVIVTVGGKETRVTLSPRTLDFIQEEIEDGWPEDWRTNPHYLLRVLQREIFRQRDSELSREIKEIRSGEAPRRLVVAENPDAIDQALKNKAAKQKVKYLRLTLNDPRELERLLTRVHIESGEVETSPGPLAEIITGGGILLIDYTNSKPQFVEQFNSLYDKANPFYGDNAASKDLVIVGVIDEKNFMESDSTFRSRFDEISFTKSEYKDPVGEIRVPASRADCVEAELFGASDFREKLLGSSRLDENGKIQIQEGFLIKALAQGKPLLIKGDSWNNPAFLFFIRQIMLHREVEFNGKIINLPEDFVIYRAESNYKEGVKDKDIIVIQLPELANKLRELNGPKLNGPVWIINGQTQDILFSRTHVTEDGKLTQLPGLLDRRDILVPQEETLRIRVEGRIADWVWHSIMHSSANVEIEVYPDTYVPAIYSSFKSGAVKELPLAKKLKTWEEVKDKKVIFVEGDDLGFIRAKLQEEFGEDAIIYPVTPATSSKQLTSSIAIASEADGTRIFQSQRKGVLAALHEGKTVFLEGIDVNEPLMRELAGSLSETPYIMDGGERINLANLPGRLIITSRSQKAVSIYAENHVEMPSDDAVTAGLLKKRFPDSFRYDDFNKIMQLKRIFRSIPAPSITGSYPREMNLSFDRLALLYEYNGNWLKAFEDVVISSYNEESELAAFMRVMVRMIFNIDDEAQKPNTIHGRKLTRILNEITPNKTWENYYWHIVDTMSLDLVKKLNIGTDYSSVSTAEAFSLVEESLVKHYEGERRAFYMRKFNITKNTDVSSAPDIDMDLYTGEENWQQRKERAIRVLGKFGAVFFRGPPGTGKSFITDEIAREMGYAKDRVVGPVTIGADASELDLIAKSVYEGGRTILKDEAIGRWIPPNPIGKTGPLKRKGRLFIVDEANLAKPDFWNFLNAFFNKKPSERYVWVDGKRRYFVEDDRVIFTGNQESLTGRKFQRLIQDHVVTINFAPFDETFLKQRLEEYIHADKPRRKELITLMLELHKTFTTMSREIDFSLRDIQEFAARVNTLLGADWKKDDVVLMAWKEYRGLFSNNEALALEHILMKKFGTCVGELEKKELEGIESEKSQEFQRAGITVTSGTARTIASVEDFLKMREARISGKSLLQGKRGLIFEGPSGRGKDIVLTQLLKSKGLPYYHINASSRVSEVIDTIQKARREGAIVIISEMNLLPSAFLEGRLNDVLTGSAHQGFALFATMNSMDYSGRERLSTALQNRVLYSRISDYTQEELYQIAIANRGDIKETEIKLVVNTHAWIRENIKRPNLKPTTRELINVLALMRDGLLRQEAIKKIYGPFYLRIVQHPELSKTADDKLRVLDNLLTFTEKPQTNNLEVLKLIGTFLIGSPTTIKMDAVTKQGGYYSPLDNSITLNTRNSLDYQLKTVDHESGHGRFTRRFEDFTPTTMDDPFFWLYYWLEDMRQEHAMKTYFPYIQLDELTNMEIGFTKAVKELNINYLCAMTPQDLFKFLLSSYAKGFITKEDVSVLADVMESLHPVNIAGYALKHLDTAKEIYECVPENLDETEIEFQSYRAASLLQPMKDDYLEIYNLRVKEEEEKKDIPQEEQTESVGKAKEELERANLGPKMGTVLMSPFSNEKKDIEAIKKGLRDERARAMARSKEDVLKELTLMERDLNSFPYIAMDRLKEILGQLENRHHPASLVARIEQLNDSKINSRAKAMRTSVKKAIERMRKIGEEAEREHGRGDRNGWGSSFWDGLRNKFSGVIPNVIGVRYPTASAHKEESVSNPIAVLPPKPEAKKVNLEAVETAARDPRMKELTQDARSALEPYIRDFFRTRLSIDRVWGSEGTLDVERFVTSDPTNSFYRSGGSEEKTHKELVLYGKTDSSEWNVILEELFHFLFEKGFCVTVYTSESSYISGIRTVGDLKRLLGEAEKELEVSGEKVFEDLSGRMRREDYEYIRVDELQHKAEAEYLYWAIKHLRIADSVQRIEKGKTEEKELSFPEQYDLAIKIARESGSPRGDVIKRIVDGKWILEIDLAEAKNIDLNEIAKLACLTSLVLDYTHLPQLVDISALSSLANLKTLSLLDTSVKDLSPLANLKNLTTLCLPTTPIQDITPLANLPKLTRLFLGATQISDEQIYELFRDNPNREGLTVNNKTDRKITYADVPLAYKSAPARLSFEAQVELAEHFLRENGFDVERCLKVHPQSKILEIRLLDQKVTSDSPLILDITPLGRLTNLALLSLCNVRVLSIAALTGATRLNSLYFIGISVSDDTVYAFFKDHPNRESLEVLNKGTKTTYLDIPPRYRTKPAGLSFKDQVLRAKVFLARNGLDAAEGGELLIVNYDNETIGLDLRSTGIQDISPLEGLLNLTELCLGYCENIKDFSALATLTNLTILELFKCSFGNKDLNSLRGLIKLKILDLTETQVTNITSLADLINLEELYLQYDEISDITSLNKLSKLRLVNLLGTKVFKQQAWELFSYNDNRKNIEVRWRDDSRVLVMTYADVPPGYRTKPVELSFEEQRELADKIRRESGSPRGVITSGMPNVNEFIELDIPDARKIDFNEIAKLTCLTRLVLDYAHVTQLTDISALGGLTNLDTLSLMDIPVEDLSPLANLKNLTTLNLSNNISLQDITPLANLPKLTYLSLGDTSISDEQIYQLFRDNPNRENLAATNKDDRMITYADVPVKYKPKPVELSFEDEKEKLEAFLRNKGLDSDERPSRLSYNPASKTLGLDLFGTDIGDNDLRELSGITYLAGINLARTMVTDLSPLHGLPNLTIVGLPQFIRNKQIYELFHNHPDEGKLQVKYEDDSQEFSAAHINSMIGWFKEELPELNFDEQVEMAKSLLSQPEFRDADGIEVNSNTQELGINFGATRFIDFFYLGQLTSLRRVSMQSCKTFKNLSVFVHLPKLRVIEISEELAKNMDSRGLFMNHPNRENLEVHIDLGTRGTKIFTFNPAWLEEAKAKKLDKINQTSPGEIDSTLAKVVKALIDPEAALEKVKQRFEEEGRLEDFVKVKKELIQFFTMKQSREQGMMTEREWRIEWALNKIIVDKLPSPPKETRKVVVPVAETKTNKVIRGTDVQVGQIFQRIGSYLTKRDEAVDIVVDLSLIPEADLDANMKTWAYLVLMCRGLENVNFIFDAPYNRSYEALALEKLEKYLRDNSALADMDKTKMDEFIRTRVNASRRKGAVEILITSKASLEHKREADIPLLEDQYPVAMDGITFIKNEGVLLRNFEAALMLGLSEAALVIAKKRDDKKKENEEKELPILKKEILSRMQALYDVFGNNVKLTEETLDNMIHHLSTVRLNLAISLALPPIVRMAVDKLKDLHTAIQDALYAA